ncbi:universal stress protein [Salinigranum rubrum]|uniref:Universal stress protein n=1 Tax=Salinigranum rubrum TaxID=755307 RepID=A0A2I8VQ33_9EURY|nr:universal stress protein [Salinigranum rubrum]AUV84006.1 universal stress protein [Salinigranum rubrum]
MYHRILLPTDGSEASLAALDHALDLTGRFDAALDVLYVVDTGALPLDAHSRALFDAADQAARGTVADMVDRAERRGVERVTGEVREGSPSEVVLDYAADHDVDLVVMGTHARTGVERYLLGSVTERVLRASPVPVLTVRGPSESD